MAPVKGLPTSTTRSRTPRGSVVRLRPRAHRSAAPRALVLTSGLGYGHVRAADAIAVALRRFEPRGVVRQLDFWSLMNAGVAATIKRKYLELVVEHSELYSRLHRLDERTWRRVIENHIAPPVEVVELIELLTRNGDRRSWSSLFEWALGPYPSDLLLYPTACAALPTTANERASGNVALLRLALLRWAFLRLQGRMEQRLASFAPDVVVATQMVPAALVSAVKQASPRWRDLPLVGVLTDFGAHDYWSQPGINLYCVPHESITGPAPGPKRGAATVVATGVPLMPSFERLPTQEAARRWLRIDTDDPRPVVLVLGGGLGLGVDELVSRLLQQSAEIRVLAMTGRNDGAAERLLPHAQRHSSQLYVHGWTEHMENYITAADLVVGKPGGLTVAEVLACGRPLLVTRTLQGQESFNVQFLERHGVGRLVPVENLAVETARWLQDPARLAALQRLAADLGRRSGAPAIARRAVELARAEARVAPAFARRSAR
jgi:UDP-N-acetylglucosamine:LPS N-acetylglucosamine transferase